MDESIVCITCGTKIAERTGPGRPRQYCSSQCRQRAYESRVAFNGETIATLAERGGYLCNLCSGYLDIEIRSGESAVVVDHMIPTAWGGQTVPENLHAVHAICNLRKGTAFYFS